MSDSWICASTASAWARFDWIGVAVAALTLVSRATTPNRASEARMRAGACRVLELFIELVRSSKGTAVTRLYPCEGVMVAGADDGCNRQLTEIPANGDFCPR